jgi:hypothetical protein
MYFILFTLGRTRLTTSTFRANHPSTAYSDATSTLPAATTTSHGAVISGDGCINLMIEYDGRDHITKMLLTYLDAEALDAHVSVFDHGWSLSQEPPPSR